MLINIEEKLNFCQKKVDQIWSLLIDFGSFSIEIDLLDIVQTQFNQFRGDDWFGFQEFGSKFWLK